MTISEWNTCLPNEYSLEGTGLMAAYGLLQGWDASLQFGYFSPDWPKGLGDGSFDLLGNPPQILQFPAASVMWLRQDVREADLVAESLYDPESVFSLSDDRKPVPLAAALVGKVGYRFVEKNRPPVVKDISPYWDPKKLVARSITGELTWDAGKGFVRVNTPRTQAVIGFLSAERHELRRIVSSISRRLIRESALGEVGWRSAELFAVGQQGPEQFAHPDHYRLSSGLSRHSCSHSFHVTP